MVPVEIGRDYGPSVEVLNGLHEGDLVVTTVTDAVQQGIKVRTEQNPQVAEDTGQTPQSGQAPDSGPDQYGDQSIVSAETGNTTQKGKSGQGQKPSGGKQQKSGSN
jgi:hypothetical protein